MEPFIRMAILQTVVDTVELLTLLHAKSNDEAEKRKIAEMIQRLATMTGSIQ